MGTLETGILSNGLAVTYAKANRKAEALKVIESLEKRAGLS